jgi:hypothetical protein
MATVELKTDVEKDLFNLLSVVSGRDMSDNNYLKMLVRQFCHDYCLDVHQIPTESRWRHNDR